MWWRKWKHIWNQGMTLSLERHGREKVETERRRFSRPPIEVWRKSERTKTRVWKDESRWPNALWLLLACTSRLLPLPLVTGGGGRTVCVLVSPLVTLLFLTSSRATCVHACNQGTRVPSSLLQYRSRDRDFASHPLTPCLSCQRASSHSRALKPLTPFALATLACTIGSPASDV